MIPHSPWCATQRIGHHYACTCVEHPPFCLRVKGASPAAEDWYRAAGRLVWAELMDLEHPAALELVRSLPQVRQEPQDP